MIFKTFIKLPLILFLTGCAAQNLADHQRTLKIADDEIMAGKPDAALGMLQREYEKSPTEPDILVRMGEANAAMGRSEPAAIFFHKALNIAPDDKLARMGLVRSEISFSPDQALLDLQAYAKSAPNDAQICNDLGMAYALTGHVLESQHAFQHTIELDPTLVSAQVNLGLSLALSGDYQHAVALLAPLSQSKDSTPRIRQDYALAETLAGNTDDARRVLSQDIPSNMIEKTINSYKFLSPHAH